MSLKHELRKLSKNELIDLLLQEKEARLALEKRLDEIEHNLRAYENPHTPSSQQRKKNTKNENDKKPRFPGKPLGSEGGGIKIPPIDRIEEHKLDVCPISGKPLGEPVGYRSKIVIDFPDKPIQVIEHRIMQYLSPVTGEIIEAKVDLPRGIYGKNLQSIVGMLKNLTNSHAKIAEFMRELGAISFSDAEVQHLTDKFAERLETEYNHILEEISKEPYLHGDETPFRRDGKNGYVWGLFTKTKAYLLVSLSRARENIEKLLSGYLGVIVSDGYNAYENFKNHHRCWAHLKREFKEYSDLSDEIKVQYERFAKLYSQLQEFKMKEAIDQVLIDQKTIDNARWIFADIVTCLKTIKSARGLVTLIENGGECWFTALYHLGVPLDNNQAERGLRPIVLLRKVIGCYRNDKGKRWIQSAYSVLCTWKMQNRSIFAGLRSLAD